MFENINHTQQIKWRKTMKELKIKKMSNMTWQKYRVQLENEVRYLLDNHYHATGERLYCHYYSSVEDFISNLPESKLKNDMNPYLDNAMVLVEIKKNIDAIEKEKLDQRIAEQKKKDAERKNKTHFKGVKVGSLSLMRYLLSLPPYEPKEGDLVACLVGQGEKLHIGSIIKREKDGKLGVRCYRRNYNWGNAVPVCLWDNAKSEFISEI